MPKVTIVDMAGKSVGERDLSEAVFGIKPNQTVVHAAVVNYLANQRQGTQSTKTRSEVRGGGRKPWRQKGTGRARQGSIRSPQWTHGGIALGPKPRSYRYSINRKTKQLAFKSLFSDKVAGGNLILVDNIQVEEYKTKKMMEALKNLGVEKKALIVTRNTDEKVVKSASNIPGVKTAVVTALNVYDILNYDAFIVSSEAVDWIEEVYA